MGRMSDSWFKIKSVKGALPSSCIITTSPDILLEHSLVSTLNLDYPVEKIKAS